MTTQPLSVQVREQLKRSLEPLHAQYDPAERMLKSPFSSPGYHTTLRGREVHRTRESLRYAAALLDTGEREHRERAFDILRRVTALQDQDPASKTYGIWSWFLEEPLSRMAPPDWNWADFCGRELLQVKLHHVGELPEDLRKLVDESVVHAARSIQRRNVGPGYTNIAILGTYVTLVAAETYGVGELKEYALARLKRFYDYTKEQGAFTEYNSPTYTLVSLKGLAQLRADVKDAGARRLIEELYALAWEEVATHFHPPTRQWAGPHSRAYSTLLRGSVLGFITRGTEGRVDFGATEEDVDLESYRVAVDCPRELEHYFTTLEEPRSVVKRFVKGTPDLAGTTYLHPRFTLGTVSRGDLWNQRRALLAYWGTKEDPSYLHLRFLQDGYDFAAAQFFSAQWEGTAIGAVNFATDGGNTHVSLDRLKEGKFTAKDLRMRFEFGGGARMNAASKDVRRGYLTIVPEEGLSIRLKVPSARVGELEGKWEVSPGAVDVVFHQGEERAFDLAQMEVAAIGFGVEMRVGAAVEGRDLETRVREGRLEVAQGPVTVSVPARPDRVNALQKAVVVETR